MKTIQALSLIGAAGLALATLHAVAAPDYDRVRKDINVMIGIIKSTFESSDECKRCRISVSGYYLADQGVVFNVRPTGGHRYAYTSEGFEHNITTFAEGMAAIPLVVEDILTEVEVSLDNEDFNFQVFSEDNNVSEATREAREALRQARAELREHNRELRELEIEAIHARDEELQELETEREVIESRISELEKSEEVTREQLNRVLAEKKAEIEQRKSERRQVQETRFNQMETMVLNTFCDYSATMRNLPRGERVSLIISKNDEQSNIYVFEQSKLASCDSSQGDVRARALTYAF